MGLLEGKRLLGSPPVVQLDVTSEDDLAALTSWLAEHVDSGFSAVGG